MRTHRLNLSFGRGYQRSGEKSQQGPVSQGSARIVREIGRVVKKPPGVFNVDRCAALSSSLEATLQLATFLVEYFNSAAQWIAKQEGGGVGCVHVDPSVLVGASAET
jgi:hypothetical protein